MDFSLQPATEAGRRFVDLAAACVPELQERAPAQDQAGVFCRESLDLLRERRVLAACIPAEFGGLGVDSAHDTVTGVNRLGRGDGSAAIAANMHIAQTWLLVFHWRQLQAAGHEAADRLGQYLRHIGTGRVVVCSVVGERGTDVLHPYLRATRTGGGWHLNGAKLFGTMTDAAQVMQVTCLAPAEDGTPSFGMATVPTSAPGVTIQGDWDALGMRASGSHGVTFTDCFVADNALSLLGPWGTWNEPFLFGNIVITLGLVAAFLGIAEAAQELVVTAAGRSRPGSGRSPAERASVQNQIAENEIDLAAARAMVGRTGSAVDDFCLHYAPGETPLEDVHQLMKDFQCTKTFVTRRAVTIVDRALTVSGGAGYTAGHPLSRLYRDVRAGSFMQPYSPNEAYEYIGRVTLGLDPELADSSRTPPAVEP